MSESSSSNPESPLSSIVISRWLAGISPDLLAEANQLAEREDWIMDRPGERFRALLDEYAGEIPDPDVPGGPIIRLDHDYIDLISVLAYTHVSRALKLLHQHTRRQPNLGNRLLQIAKEIKDREDHPHRAEARVIHERISHLVKSEMYEQVLGSKQRAHVRSLLDTPRKEEAREESGESA